MKDVQRALRIDLEELERAGEVLRYSYQKCSMVPVRPSLSPEELESFEALTSRFARLSDIIIQRIFRTLDVIDLEDSGTARDRINRADKRGIISSAEEFVQIRLLRNEIAHDYKSEKIFNIFERVLALTPILMDSLERISNYAQKRIFYDS